MLSPGCRSSEPVVNIATRSLRKTLAGCRGPLPKPSQPTLDIVVDVRQFDRELARETSPGFQVAFGNTNDYGNAAVDRARYHIAQSTPLTFGFPEFVEYEQIRSAFQRPLDPRTHFR